MTSPDNVCRPSGALSRRKFLTATGAAGTAIVLRGIAVPSTASAATRSSVKDGNWSDPLVWGGTVPGPGDVARITHRVVLNVSTKVAGTVVEPGAELTFLPGGTVTLDSFGNVIVRGTLRMAPSGATIVHTLRFVGVKESAFVGGGMDPIASDVGLWVVDAGVLALLGTPKRAWTEAAGSVPATSTSIALACAADGWVPGDEVVVTPTGRPGSGSAHVTAFDLLTLAAVSGSTVSTAKATAFAHPSVDMGGRVATAEVLNLTRNVRIEGTPGGRSHVFVRSSAPQTISHVSIRYVGPQKPGGLATTGRSATPATSGGQPVLGRYGLHFHHCMDGSRGSLVEGVVVRDAGNHAFVPHMSHGVTLLDCIAHNSVEDAYWWDKNETSDDTLLLRCVASQTNAGVDERLTGFRLGRGEGNVARGCVAVGVNGDKTSSGFHWPEVFLDKAIPGLWVFEDCVAHNNATHGIFVWQNSPLNHLVSRYAGYHNGGAGISHGAYLNSYRYESGHLYGNLSGGILIWANATGHAPLYVNDLAIDSAGLCDHAVEVREHTLPKDGSPPDQPTVLYGCSFKNYKKAAVGFLNPTPKVGSAERYEVIDCSFGGNGFWLSSGLVAGSVIKVQDAVHGAVELRRKDQKGTLNPTWNARVTPIPAFAQPPAPPALLAKSTAGPDMSCQLSPSGSTRVLGRVEQRVPAAPPAAPHPHVAPPAPAPSGPARRPRPSAPVPVLGEDTAADPWVRTALPLGAVGGMLLGAAALLRLRRRAEAVEPPDTPEAP
jgi:hypothetical protein